MKKILLLATIGLLATSCFAGVTIYTPGSGATVGSPVHISASASGAGKISAIIAYVSGNEVSRTYSSSLDAYASVGGGYHTLVVNAWDNYGNLYQSSRGFTVGSSSTSTSTSSGSTGVWVSSPAPSSTVSSPVHFKASASGTARISAIFVYVDGNTDYESYSNTLDGYVKLGSGWHNAVVKAWDDQGNVYKSSFGFTVSGSSSSTGTSTTSTSSSGTTIYDLQAKSGWHSCTVCAGAGGNGPSAYYYMSQWQTSPSLSGQSTKFALTGADAPYADVLFYHSVIPDTADPSINRNAHHFVYDTYFYINNGGVSQALEFDINQYVNGHQLIWGTQCNIRGGNHWDIYDNQNWHWVSTGIYCGAPSSYTWHHVVLEVARATDGSDRLHYISITLDGNKHYLDWWMAPTSSSWNVATVNFQMDIDGSRDPYAVWLDKLNVTYW